MEIQRFSTSSRILSSWGQSCQPIWRKRSDFDACEQIININVLIEILVQQSNLYSQKNWRTFLTSA